MRKTLVLFLVFVLSSSFVCGDPRREPESKKQERGGLVYVGNEQTPYTGVMFIKHPNGKLLSEATFRNGEPVK